jgi:hypothetical protein
MASDTNKEVVDLFQGRNSEGGGADLKTSQNNGTNIYWEIIVDNAGGRRNVSVVRRSEVSLGMDKPLPGINESDEEDTTKDQMQTGHVGLKIDVSGDDKEKTNKEQEPTTSRGVKEMFEQFYEVAGYFTGLLDFEGNVLFVLLQSVFLFIKTLKNKAGNIRITYHQARSVTTVSVKNAIIISYSGCAFVALNIQHAMRMSHNHYLINGTIFEKKKY